MREFWTLYLAHEVTKFIYTLPRGQAVELRDALAILRTNPKPEGAKPLVIEELSHSLCRMTSVSIIQSQMPNIRWCDSFARNWS